MTDTSSVMQARERAWRYWESDGFYLLIVGLAWTLLGLFYYWRHSPSSPVGEFWADLFSLAAILLVAEESSAGYIVGWLKTRVTYPRTGYVAPPQETAELPIDKTLFAQPKQSREEAVEKIQSGAFLLLILAFLLHLQWLLWAFVLLHAYLSWHFRNWAYIPWHRKYVPPLLGLLLALLPFTMSVTGAIAIAGLA